MSLLCFIFSHENSTNLIVIKVNLLGIVSLISSIEFHHGQLSLAARFFFMRSYYRRNLPTSTLGTFHKYFGKICIIFLLMYFLHITSSLTYHRKEHLHPVIITPLSFDSLSSKYIHHSLAKVSLVVQRFYFLQRRAKLNSILEYCWVPLLILLGPHRCEWLAQGYLHAPFDSETCK